MHDPRTTEAIALMTNFAERTGLGAGYEGRRYLWTDAFAVCNFLGLAGVTRDKRYMELALQLTDQVHWMLGRHRKDDARSGWISGLGEQQGRAHPTRGGLRIGKQLPERGADEAMDERLEWDRDGQYFHYLTKWMHALDQLARATQQAQYNLWARELAATAFGAFSYVPPPSWSSPRMHWKMSIDLSRPLVASMGQHDPLDGYITALQLRATAAVLAQTVAEPDLAAETAQYAVMTRRHAEWETADPLGIGNLLIDAYRVAQLTQQGASPGQELLQKLLATSLSGLQHYARSGELQLPLEYRLAFRELGLAIGLHAVQRMWQAARKDSGLSSTRAQLQALMRYLPMRDDIESFWRNPEHHANASWSEHRDINEVMLATSLAPDGFLVLQPPN